MQRTKSTPIINNNNPPYFFPNNHQKPTVKRIKPNKFTFLDSNLMISNILNHQKNSLHLRQDSKNHMKNQHSLQEDDNQEKFQIINRSKNAYTNCHIENQKFLQQKQLQNAKINKIRQQANAFLRGFSQDKKEYDKQIQQKAQIIQKMKEQMMDRAGQIMAKRQDSQYTGRNVSKTGAKMLKQCKQKDALRKLFKLQSTRKVMKDKTKQNDVQKNQSLQVTPQQSLSESVGSFVDTSCYYNQVQKQNQADSSQNKLLTNMLRNKSYDQVFSEQRRRGVCVGFMRNWKNFDDKNAQNLVLKKKTKKLHLQNRQPKQQKHENDHKGIYLGTDKSKRYFGLNDYTKNFDQLATAYTIFSR